jgi:hypothetical protein
MKKAIVILLAAGVVVGTGFFLTHIMRSEPQSGDEASGISIEYPQELPTKYISPQDWPPQLQVLNEPFTCTNAGSPEARAGRSETRVINGRTYCVTEVVGAAAGSVYKMFAYATEKNSKTAILTFTIREVQCGNYDEPEKTACEKERKDFNLDQLVDQMFQ